MKLSPMPERLRLTAERDRDMTTGGWLLGDAITIADLALAPTFDRMANLGLSRIWQDFPGVDDWFKRISARPAYAKAYYAGRSPCTHGSAKQAPP
jgi:glutathione S-transferase